LKLRRTGLFETDLSGPSSIDLATIVAGTTATFGYIIDWALRASRHGGELIEVNPEETPLSRFATRSVRKPAAIALPRLIDLFG
jgi:NAD-dependent SIR2 family protein deacetylase